MCTVFNTPESISLRMSAVFSLPHSCTCSQQSSELGSPSSTSEGNGSENNMKKQGTLSSVSGEKHTRHTCTYGDV